MNEYFISFPRSGSTLLRYLIEQITHIPTHDPNPQLVNKRSASQWYGRPIKFEQNKPLFVKLHGWPVSQEPFRVHIHVRNYKECIEAHCRRSSKPIYYDKFIQLYADLLTKWYHHLNRGVLVFFEDLIDLQKQPTILREVLEAFKITNYDWNFYLKNIQSLNEQSFKSYTHLYGPTEKSADLEKRKQLDARIMDLVGEEIYNLYLERYREKE